ncbi:DsbA family oxidoreductase [Streptomyces sp. PU-14G]|uniref:DsbA family oxidoreductase n=1 Tax=Streptomyces sp. PU-14G TaxID=2800808 RepID=UPI0034DEBD54
MSNDPGFHSATDYAADGKAERGRPTRVVEVFFDVVCPWCYIGKRRVAAAVNRLPPSRRPRLVWRSFELDPSAGTEPGPTAAEAMTQWWGDRAAERVALIRDEGAAEGLELNLHVATPVSSLDAHRLVHAAAEHDLADAMVERLLRAYHTEGLDIADPHVLTELGTEAGLAPEGVRAVLESEAFAAAVREDERAAAALGVTGVPSLVIDGGRPLSGTRPEAALRLLSEHP